MTPTDTKWAEALREAFIQAAALSVSLERRGAYKSASDVADCIFTPEFRAALAAHDAEQALPRKERPDFMAGYVAGLADGRRCAERDSAEQAAKAVPAGFKLVPVEPTPEMKTAGLNVEVYQDSPPEPESLTWAEVRAIYRAMLSAAPRPGAVAGWQPISTAPKDGRKMLLFYLNANGQARRVIGGWVTAEEAAETDADDVGLEAGWYERIDNWPDYCQVAINEGEPTHWMPLPAAPQEPTHG